MDSLFNKLSQIRDVTKRRIYLERKGLSKPEIERLLEEVHLQIKGKKKFPRAHQMKFNREGLAQASSKYVAEYRTWKMRKKLGAIQKALDVGSGIGGDTIAMSLRWKVLSVEKSPVTMEMLKHNIQVYNTDKNIELILGDISILLEDNEFQKKLGDIDCIFFDPSRRSRGRRTVKIEEYEPPLLLVEKLNPFSQNICVKIAPGVDLSRITYDCDIEVISFKGEVKEVVLWFGKFKTYSDKKVILATKLPEKITWIQKPKRYNVPVSEPKDFIYEPDPAFIKAHLISDIAELYKLSQLNKKIAYLTSDTYFKTPILKCYHVLAYETWDHASINKTLSKLNIGNVDLKSRGLSVDLKDIQKSIHGNGRKNGLLILTKILNSPSAIICEYTN